MFKNIPSVHHFEVDFSSYVIFEIRFSQKVVYIQVEFSMVLVFKIDILSKAEIA